MFRMVADELSHTVDIKIVEIVSILFVYWLIMEVMTDEAIKGKEASGCF